MLYVCVEPTQTVVLPKIASGAKGLQFSFSTNASGEPFAIHPMEVALILARIRLDSDTIAGALLHDLVEDTDVTYEDIEKAFGIRVSSLVNGVTKLSKLPWAGDVDDQSKREKEAQAESLRKMFLAMVDDIGVVLIKLADRLHNMRTLQYMPSEKQQRIAQQTMEIYAPLAARRELGQLQLDQLVERLVQSAKDRGGRDNITVVLVTSESTEEDEEEEFDEEEADLYEDDEDDED